MSSFRKFLQVFIAVFIISIAQLAQAQDSSSPDIMSGAGAMMGGGSSSSPSNATSCTIDIYSATWCGPCRAMMNSLRGQNPKDVPSEEEILNGVPTNGFKTISFKVGCAQINYHITAGNAGGAVPRASGKDDEGVSIGGATGGPDISSLIKGADCECPCPPKEEKCGKACCKEGESCKNGVCTPDQTCKPANTCGTGPNKKCCKDNEACKNGTCTPDTCQTANKCGTECCNNKQSCDPATKSCVTKNQYCTTGQARIQCDPTPGSGTVAACCIHGCKKGGGCLDCSLSIKMCSNLAPCPAGQHCENKSNGPNKCPDTAQCVWDCPKVSCDKNNGGCSFYQKCSLEKDGKGCDKIKCECDPDKDPCVTNKNVCQAPATCVSEGDPVACYKPTFRCTCNATKGLVSDGKNGCKCSDPEKTINANGECACPDGQEDYQGECVDKCKSGQFRNEEGICQCTDDSKEVVNGNCIDKCPQGQTRVSGGEACQCPFGLFTGSSSDGCKGSSNSCGDRLCVAEAVPNVTGCYDQKCVDCPEGAKAVNNVCTCPKHQAVENNKCECTNKDKKCSIDNGGCGAQVCEDISEEGCIINTKCLEKCTDPNKEFINGKCLDKCKGNKHREGEECKCNAGICAAPGQGEPICASPKNCKDKVDNEGCPTGEHECKCPDNMKEASDGVCEPVCQGDKVYNRQKGLCECPKGTSEMSDGKCWTINVSPTPMCPGESFPTDNGLNCWCGHSAIFNFTTLKCDPKPMPS